MKKSSQPLISELYSMINTQSSYFNESKSNEQRNKDNINANSNTTDVNTQTNIKQKPAEIINHFLQKEKNYGQRRTYKQFCYRNQLRLKELNLIQTKPHIDNKSEALAKKKNVMPLYTRIDEEVNNQNTNLESLRNLYLQSSKTEAAASQESPKDKQAFKGYSEKTLAWINSQEDWRKKKERNIQVLYTKIYDQDDNRNREESDNKMKRHLTISQPNITVNMNHGHNYNRTSNESRNYLNTINIPMSSSLNLRKEFVNKQFFPSFSPKLNRNRRDKSKLIPQYMAMVYNGKRRVNSTKTNNANHPSLELKMNKTGNTSSLDQMKKKANKKREENWKKIIMNLSRNNNKNNESLYKLNICPTGAWNENCINNIELNSGQNMGILTNFIQR